MHKDDTRYVELIWQTILTSNAVPNQENIHEVSGGELTDIQWIKKSDLRKGNIKPEFLKDLVH